jgi:hypothetical protein
MGSRGSADEDFEVIEMPAGELASLFKADDRDINACSEHRAHRRGGLNPALSVAMSVDRPALIAI